MLMKFDSKRLQGQLSDFTLSKQLAFGAICCERLIHNYTAFSTETCWGNVTPIREALDFIWRVVENEDYHPKAVQKHLSKCEAVIPDSDDFVSLYVSSAQDACLAVCCLLDYLLKNDIERIVQVATYATDSVDLYVQEIEDMQPSAPDLEQRILRHSLMQRELNEQKENLVSIDRQSLPLNSVFSRSLVGAWLESNRGKSNLNLPLDIA